MSSVNAYMQKMQQNLTNGMFTAAIAEIIKVDLQMMKADVKLLDSTEALIMEVPIAAQRTEEFIIRMPYKVSDKVVVMFTKEDTAPFLYGSGDPSESQHDKDNAIIVSGIADYLSELPADFAEYEEDVVFANTPLTAAVVLKKSGEILLKSDESINLETAKDMNFNASGIVAINDSRGSRL